jgi:fructokinase
MIVCCGEALIDMIPQRYKGKDMLRPVEGGAIYNTSLALGRLGSQCALFSGISNDAFGHQLLNKLQASGVDTSLIARSDRLTTLAFVHLANGHASYTFYDENSAGRMLSSGDLPDFDDNICALYFGGISLINNPAADTYLSLAQREADKRVIVFDPNIRPDFITDPKDYRQRMDAFLEIADIIKMSDEDLEWFDPSPGNLTAKFQRVGRADTALRILTKGGDGAMGILSNGDVCSVSAKRVEVVDTVGAGDTFNAGVMAYLQEQGLLTKSSIGKLCKEDTSQALRYGAAAAAVTVQHAGAESPWKDDLQFD